MVDLLECSHPYDDHNKGQYHSLPIDHRTLRAFYLHNPSKQEVTWGNDRFLPRLGGASTGGEQEPRRAMQIASSEPNSGHRDMQECTIYSHTCSSLTTPERKTEPRLSQLRLSQLCSTFRRTTPSYGWGSWRLPGHRTSFQVSYRYHNVRMYVLLTLFEYFPAGG